MIIDFHTHTFPAGIAAGAVSRLKEASHTLPFTDGTLPALAASMEKAGVNFSVVQPVATNPRQVPHVNDASVRIQESSGETGILSFGCMHPDYEDWRGELSRISRLGLHGVKLHPPYQLTDFDDPRYLRILEKCGELGLIVLTHAGLDVGLPGHREATPEKLLRAVRAVGPVTLVLAHMGGWRCWEQAEALAEAPTVYLDTSFSLGSMTPLGDGFYPDEASLARLDETAFLHIIRRFGARRILFGTDSPWESQAGEVRKIRALSLTEEEKSLILGENARILLGFPDVQRASAAPP